MCATCLAVHTTSWHKEAKFSFFAVIATGTYNSGFVFIETIRRQISSRYERKKLNNCNFFPAEEFCYSVDVDKMDLNAGKSSPRGVTFNDQVWNYVIKISKQSPQRCSSVGRASFKLLTTISEGASLLWVRTTPRHKVVGKLLQRHLLQCRNKSAFGEISSTENLPEERWSSG